MRRWAHPAGTRAIASLCWNDTRALLPVWLIGVAAVTIAALTPRRGSGGDLAFGTLHALAVVSYVAATLGLGAQSFGYEYTHRTLGQLLMLPVDRGRLLVVKLGVLTALVVPLAAYAWISEVFAKQPVLLWLSAGAALCLTPALTMLCRSALAGAVFSASMPGMVLGVVTLVYTYNDRSDQAEHAALVAWAWLMVPLLASAAPLGWRRFMRLEWAEGGSQEMHIAWPSRSAPDGRSRHPLWLLVKKELHLQRMAFALTALYLIGTTLAIVAFGWPDVDASALAALQAASSIYWLGLPILVGSLTIAEERHLGTLSWQSLLPMPAWHQWAVKSGTVFTLALLLGLGVPMSIAAIYWPAERPNLGLVMVLTTVTTAASMYISSLCTAGVRAALASLVAIPLGLWLVVTLAVVLRNRSMTQEFGSGREDVWFAVVVLAVVLLMAFAFVNRRPEPPAASQIRRQAISLAALIVVGLLTLAATL